MSRQPSDTRTLIIQLAAIVIGVILYVGWGTEDAIIGVAFILLVAYLIARDLKQGDERRAREKQ